MLKNMYKKLFDNRQKGTGKNFVVIGYSLLLMFFAMCIFLLGSVLACINSFKNVNELNLFDSKYEIERIEEHLLNDFDNDVFVNGKIRNKIITGMFYNNFFNNIIKKMIVSNSICVKNARMFRKNVYGKSEFFPILVKGNVFNKIEDEKDNKDEFTYDNTWGAARNYGGNRVHEGVDIMYSKNKRDEVPIVSISDGIVVKKGWLKLGGNRLYIKASDKLYFFYAHLSSYENGIKEGEKVYAGQILGYMGDTGYGKEGTKGKFPVHLHLGMYYKDDKGKDRALNPYFLLKFLENYKLYYQN